MNRIDSTFEKLAHRQEKALVGFVTAGDPDPELSMRIILGMCRAGLDVLELGVPFSDPTADGPVIQRSSARALKRGTNLKTVLDMTRRIRRETSIPVVLFSYYNPILCYGPEPFHRDALDAGADGVLVVDLPPEESRELTDRWSGNALHLIRLVAPTTPPDRMQRIADSATGFIYLVSKTGVTGSDGLDTSDVGIKTNRLREVSGLPICVGFGISTAAHVRAVAKVADGVVIGSAFERTIEENIEVPDLAEMLAAQTADYKAATG
jgi:tryptophan synthase alpha chain